MTTLSELTPRWLERLQPIAVRWAVTEAEREASFRLRYEAVVERGWAAPSAYSDKQERDAFDELALHAGAWLGDTLLASTRMLLPVAGMPLPTELAFGLTVEPAGRVADVGRTVVARGLGALGREVLIGILLHCWEEARSHDMLSCCGAFAPAVIRLYRQLGVEAVPLAPPRILTGIERRAILVDITDRNGGLAANLERRLTRPRPSLPSRGDFAARSSA